MRDAARSGSTKSWALSNWDLRWKVTAVLAVPLLVAVVLGASRISAEFAESSRLSTAVDHVGVIPAITGLSAAAAQVASGQSVMLGPTQSITSEPELAKLDTAIAFAEKAAPRLSDIPSARQALDKMIVTAKAVRAQGLAPSKTVSDAINQVEDIRTNSVKTVEQIVATVSDRVVDTAKLKMVDSLNTRAVMVSEIGGFAEALRGNAKDGVREIQVAVAAERQMLGVLQHRFNDGDPTIAELFRQVDTRIQLTSSTQAGAGTLPVSELKDSLEASLVKYQSIVNDTTKDITNRVDTLASTARSDAIRYSIIVVATILGALALAVLIARAMIVPLRRLRLAALRVAEYDLSQEVTALRDGADPEEVPLEPMPVHTDEEIGQLARAVDDIHGQALRLAADQAAMRSQVNDMFETLARRSKSLVDHQLSLIEAMEYDEKDPRLLENLFRLDHLAARMRRNGDNLLILAGTTKQRRGKAAPVEIADVLRAAISEVEDYERVKLGATPRGSLVEPAASDLAHLFAELLDNALRASPPETDVKFTFAQAHDQGLLIEVSDRGIGMPPAEMAEINRKLESTAEVGPDTARHMGLFVVGRLAERHGLTVRLRPTLDSARDPGVTVTVHVPKPLIVAAGGGLSVPQQSAPAAPAPQGAGNQAGASASMQMRAVTRTATGNVMVTVDPGVSGPIPAGAPAPAAPAPAAASAATGLPQRTPGVSTPAGMPQRDGGSGGLPQRSPGDAAAASGLPTRQPGVNGPTVKHTVAPAGGTRPGLPQRDPGANQPVGLQGQPGASLPPRAPGEAPARPGGGLAANMLKRQGGLPPRPGGPGAPGGPGDSALPPRGPGGLPQRDQSGAMPQREPAEGGLPSRDANGLPQRGDSVLPGRGDSALPGRGDTALPQRGESAAGGLPTRQPGANGAPGREPGVGQPPRGGSAPRTAASGLPLREPGANGAPQRDAGRNGLPPRDGGAPGAAPGAPESGLPQRGPGGLPQRGAGSRDVAGGGLPQRDAAGGLPERGAAARGDAPGGLPQRGENGLPQRGANGLPQRGDSAAGGLPSREPGANGLPQRGDATRDSGKHGLPQRDSGANGLPQRGDAANGLPQRGDALGGLPQRGEAANGLPQRGDVAGGLPQRGANGLPQRGDSAAGGLPTRQPGSTPGLPQRDPGAGLPQRPAPLPGVGLPQPDPGSAGDARDRGRHSFRSNPQKAASFFQTRLQPAGESEATLGTPIFAEMMSAWLSDPNADRSQVAASFESPGDEGWQAAQRANESQAEKRTAAGLPQRDPGNRLVPGGVTGSADRTPQRDPESIRSSLSRHQQGVRDGRAMKAMNLTGDKGDR
ncbi:ATP-binding protein [Nocardia huaxiensis]|uniref:ATP-binding protein n=1 Tax=Nocardia huaxiensis TaxID=2755382 RepID=UPI001E3094E2|nr:ATP-binding protein [Nocardia huaxiensis]UFS95232.1 ATP-binding protein [Nocardia huaxiensis]